jgi:hypothetical protein
MCVRQTKTQKTPDLEHGMEGSSKSEAVVAREKTPPPLNSKIHQHQGGR